MTEENTTPKIVLKEIRRTKEDFTVTHRDLQTEDGTPFQLQEVDGFISATDAQRLANNGPVLAKGNVEIKDSHGTWITKEPILMVVTHGFRVGDEHKIRNQGEPESLDSAAVMKSIVTDREQRQEKDRIRILVSCDSETDKPRWDEGQLASQLGVIGFAGNVNSMTTRAAEEIFSIDSTNLRSPFEDTEHQNRWLVDPVRSPFKRATLKL